MQTIQYQANNNRQINETNITYIQRGEKKIINSNETF